MRPKQLALLKAQKSSYGGELAKTRQGRSGPRPIATKYTMHLVLRSSKAKGHWSFKTPKNEHAIKSVISKFALKYGVKIVSLANVGNHLHLHVKLSHRYSYTPFIRATTAAIAMAITGVSRWSKQSAHYKVWSAEDRKYKGKFWDYRPFTRIVHSFKEFLNLKDYIKINELEGYGYSRDQARFIISNGNNAYFDVKHPVFSSA